MKIELKSLTHQMDGDIKGMDNIKEWLIVNGYPKSLIDYLDEKFYYCTYYTTKK